MVRIEDCSHPPLFASKTMDEIQPQRSRPPDVNLQKPQSGLPTWVWVLIVLAVLGPVSLVCCGLGAAFFASQRQVR
jgi:hypothetical protein